MHCTTLYLILPVAPASFLLIIKGDSLRTELKLLHDDMHHITSFFTQLTMLPPQHLCCPSEPTACSQQGQPAHRTEAATRGHATHHFTLVFTTLADPALFLLTTNRDSLHTELKLLRNVMHRNPLHLPSPLTPPCNTPACGQQGQPAH